jgi:aminodeoxyfutalosine synthase
MSTATLALEDRLLDRTGLGEIRRKVDAGERLSFDDGVLLYQHPNLQAVGALAHRVRLRRHGRRTFFNVNLHIDYTNVCIYSCRFCAFAAKPGEERAYLMTPQDVEARLAQFRGSELSEVHMVAGLHPDMGYDYYLDVVRAAKRGKPDVHVKAFTMVEIDHILKLAAQQHGKSEDQVFADLREAGLGSCPGGGAEVLVDRVWRATFMDKIGPDEWLSTARKVQAHGFQMNATMLYGHVEKVPERVTHLLRLRELQDETHGFLTFIPLAFWPYNSRLEKYGKVSTGWLDLRMVAVSRLMLDNFPHVKAYWIMLTPKVAQAALSYGANDLDGTVHEERITHDAGTTAPMLLPKGELVHLIRSAGFEPVLRDTTYRTLQPVA